MIFDRVDIDLNAGRFDQVSKLLENLDPTNMERHEIVGWLRVTDRAKDKLPGRETFRSRAIRFAERTGQPELLKLIEG